MIALLPALLAQGAAAPAAPSAIGLWTNPQRSVEVRTQTCGRALCGVVVAADGRALADARAAGVPNLIGIELLRNYRATGPDRWAGSVFVPDRGRSYRSWIVQTGPDALRISGCILGGLICRSQLWRRA